MTDKKNLYAHSADTPSLLFHCNNAGYTQAYIVFYPSADGSKMDQLVILLISNNDLLTPITKNVTQKPWIRVAGPDGAVRGDVEQAREFVGYCWVRGIPFLDFPSLESSVVC